MRTERLCIRKFRVDDLDDLFALLSDDDVMKYLEAPYTREMTEAFLYRYGITDTPLIYAVENHRKTFVGYVIYHPYDAVSYEIGWILHKNQWGKGYASELTKCLIEEAKSKRRSLIIECSPSQAATKEIALKHQFSFIENRDELDIYMLHLNGNEANM